MTTMLSIIVAIYNVEKYLQKCIQSITAQTFTDFELILVDDGSTDACPAICDEWAQKDTRIRVIHKTNGGLRSGLMAGQKLASGQYTGYVDGDDCIAPDFFETLLKYMVEFDADIVSSGWVHCVGEKILKQRIYNELVVFDKNDIEEKILVPFWRDGGNPLIGWNMSRWNKLWKTCKLNTVFDILTPNVDMGEDVETNLCYLPLCERAVIIPNFAGYFLQDNPQSMTHGFNYKKIAQLRRYLTALQFIATRQNRAFLCYEDMNDGLMADLLWQVQESNFSFADKKKISKEIKEEMLSLDIVSKKHLRSLPFPIQIGMRQIVNGHSVLGTIIVQMCIMVVHLKNKGANECLELKTPPEIRSGR